MWDLEVCGCEIELLYEQMQWITGSGSRSVMILAELKAFPKFEWYCVQNLDAKLKNICYVNGLDSEEKKIEGRQKECQEAAVGWNEQLTSLYISPKTENARLCCRFSVFAIDIPVLYFNLFMARHLVFSHVFVFLILFDFILGFMG